MTEYSLLFALVDLVQIVLVTLFLVWVLIRVTR